MKFAAIIEYNQNQDEVKTLHSTHRDYLRRFLKHGQLRAAGPLTEAAGATWVPDAETVEAAEDIVRGTLLSRWGHCELVGAAGRLLVSTRSKGSKINWAWSN